MKTFEQEYSQLADWMREKTNIYLEKVIKEKPKGHDSKLNYERAQDVKEYNRRLSELQKKHGITTKNKTTYGLNSVNEPSNIYASGK